MRKYRKALGIGMLSLMVLGAAACGKKADTTTEATEKVTMASESTEKTTEAEKETRETLEIQGSEEESQKESSAEKETEKKVSDLQILADQVKKAVADQDLEAMADLVAYPIGIVSPDGEGIEIANKDEFLKLKPEDIFTDRLRNVIRDIDTSKMETDKDDLATMGEGTIHIALGMTEEGNLKVVAISR